MKKKNWTGERLETHVFDSNTVEHLHRYAIASQFAKGKDVLDLACGEGYGSNLLSRVASNVIGVDIAKDVIRHASQKYKNDRLNFLEGAADQIPLEDNSVDLVVSFETIEHHDKHHEMLKEIKRVLKKDGIMIMSSPDKLYYNDRRNFKNIFHVKELYENQFKELVKRFFKNADFYFQNSFYSSIVIPEVKYGYYTEYTGTYTDVFKEDNFQQLYIVSIASDESIKNLGITSFKDVNYINFILKEKEEVMKRSLSYRLGNFLLFPLKFLYNIFKRM